MKTYKQFMEEIQNPKSSEVKSKCWKGYVAVGMKRKKGKWVPNCVPESVNEMDSSVLQIKKSTPKNRKSPLSQAQIDAMLSSDKPEKM